MAVTQRCTCQTLPSKAEDSDKNPGAAAWLWNGDSTGPEGRQQWSWRQQKGHVFAEAGGQRQDSEEVADEI